jgi:hypothetical protein
VVSANLSRSGKSAFSSSWIVVKRIGGIGVRRQKIEELGSDTRNYEAALAMAQRDGPLDAGCSTLLSEDMQDGRTIAGGLTIRNPFKQVW